MGFSGLYPMRFVIFFVTVLSLYGGEQYREYDVRSAVINYEISGSDFMSNQSQLSIEGQATLLFDKWGAKSLYKEKYTQTMTGILENKQTFSSMILDDSGNIYDVDFDKSIINTREDSNKKKAIELKENRYLKRLEELPLKGKNVGTSVVLGYVCDEWQIDDVKECIYKGIILKEEYNRDILRVKRAVKIQFDLDIHDELFLLPPFMQSESVGFLLDEKSAVISKSSAEAAKKEDETAKNIPKSDEVETKTSTDKALSTVIFNKQKELLPQLLETLKEARACMENAEVKDEANACFEPIDDLRVLISGKASKSYKVEYWLEIDKEKKRNALDKEILLLKQSMPCIRRSRNIDDLSECIDSKEYQ